MSSKQSISVKVVIIGEPAVGKTTLRENFVGAGMQGDYLMTLGVDMAQSQIKIDENLSLDAQIWDIAGQDSLETITNQFLAGTQGAIFVFDLTRDYTFEKINSWLDRLHAENPDLENNIPFVIVGNKSDLGVHIKVNDEDVNNYMEYVDRHQVYSKTPTEYVKTSAKTGSKVKEAFTRLGHVIVQNFKQLDGTVATPEVDSEKMAKLEETLVPVSIDEAEPTEEEIQQPESTPVVDIPSAPTPISTPPPMPEPEPVIEETPEPVAEIPSAPTPISTPPPMPEPKPVVEETPEPVVEIPSAPTPMSTPPPAPEPEPVVQETPEPVVEIPSAPTPMSTPPPMPAPKPIVEEVPEPVSETVITKPVLQKETEVVATQEPEPVSEPVSPIIEEETTIKPPKKAGEPLSDEEIKELLKQKDERKKKLFGRLFGKK
ncbi:MAG: GTP-binding protein [Candidatus Kariarchaeaceae archaeon]|jgi:small GTP-binding protein